MYAAVQESLDPSEEVALLHSLKAAGSGSSDGDGEGLSAEERAYLHYATKQVMPDELHSYLEHIDNAAAARRHAQIPR